MAGVTQKTQILMFGNVLVCILDEYWSWVDHCSGSRSADAVLRLGVCYLPVVQARAFPSSAGSICRECGYIVSLSIYRIISS